MIILVGLLIVLGYGGIQLMLFVSLCARIRQASTEHTMPQREGYSLALVVLPTGLFMLANSAFRYPWYEPDVEAFWLAASACLFVCLWIPRLLYRSILNFMAIVGLAIISLCYTLASMRDLQVLLAPAPFASFVNLSLLGLHVWRCGELKLNHDPLVKLFEFGKEFLMNAQRFIAIAAIFAVASIAWTILGGTIEYRTDELEQSLSKEVDTMWGPSGIVQSTPCIIVGAADEMKRGEYDTPIGSDIDVSFEHHNRYKGLLWFSTYTVRFSGAYRLGAVEKDAAFLFKLPDDVPLENLAIKVDGEPVEPAYSTTHEVANTLEVPITAGAERAVSVDYTTRARDRWAYSSQWHTGARPAILRNFTMTARTDFADIDYPKGSVSPTVPAGEAKSGAVATWRYDSMRANQTMGIEMPERTNAGPIAARMSFFAPVSLAFFFTVLFTVVVLKKLPLHPMHYLFISAGFFAFHILMAYLVDLISIHAAFWVCAAVSTALVVSYMRLVAGVKFAVIYVGAAQLVYLVGFSYAFFWVGATGLTLTIGAIATLFVLMQATGRVDWSEVFRRSPDSKPAQWVTVPPLPDEAPKEGETE